MHVHSCFWETFMVPVVINLIIHFLKKKTHSKLIVGVHRSFPHRSGVMKALHVVGLVEAAHGVWRARQRLKSNKWNKINNSQKKEMWLEYQNCLFFFNHSIISPTFTLFFLSKYELNMLFTDLIIWSGTGLFFRRGGISRTGCTVKHWISGSDHSGMKHHYMMESISTSPRHNVQNWWMCLTSSGSVLISRGTPKGTTKVNKI